jgi:hypothetical protein
MELCRGMLPWRPEASPLNLRTYLRRDLMPVVPKVWGHVAKAQPPVRGGWQILGNDRYGNCGPAVNRLRRLDTQATHYWRKLIAVLPMVSPSLRSCTHPHRERFAAANGASTAMVRNVANKPGCVGCGGKPRGAHIYSVCSSFSIGSNVSRTCCHGRCRS